MTIQTPLRTRLAFGIGGGLLILITLWLTWYGIAVGNNDPVTLGIVGVVFVGAFGAMTAFGTLPTSLRADHDTVVLHRFFGSPRTAQRSTVKSIALVPAARGIRIVELRDADGEVLISTAAGFRPADLTRLADHLGVPFHMG
jgi:hypothetical protein